MAEKQITRNIALTPHFDRLLQGKVASGRYQSVSEVVREGLRLLEERDQAQERARLREEIELGWQQSHQGNVADGPAVFAEIRQMSKARRGKSKSSR